MAKEFEPRENLTVGKSTFYNGRATLKGRGPITIGSFCAIGDNLRIIAGNNHNLNFAAIQVTFYKSHFGGRYPGAVPDVGVSIGSDVWIGDNVTLLDGARVGDGCCIAAGAVVKGEIPDYTIAGGVPAKVLRDRFAPEIKEIFQEIAWWAWDPEKIKRNRDLFYCDLSTMSAAEVRALLKP